MQHERIFALAFDGVDDLGVATGATVNSGAVVGVGAGSPQATLAETRASTPMTRYLFNSLTRNAGSVS